MSNIIHLVPASDGPRVSSFELAQGLGTTHGATIKLVRRYQEDFSEFGRVRFEIRPFDTKGGQQSREVAMLNEDQAYLLLSYSRNVKRVRSLKKELIRAFSEVRRAGYTRRLSIMEQLAVLDAKDATSQVKGQLGSRLMNERKFDLRTIRPRRMELERELQPQLALNA